MNDEPLLFHTPDGPIFRSPHEMAMLREEWDGRLEATFSDGVVAHRPGPLCPHPALHRVAPGVLVNPAHVARREGLLHLPGGWTLPDAELPPPAPATPPDPGTVVALARQDGRWWWLTLAGAVPCDLPRDEARARHPELVAVGDAFVLAVAVRGLRRQKEDVFVSLDGGHTVKANRKTLDPLAAALGLPWPDTLASVPERHRVAYERGLRDWPVELIQTDDAELRRRYSEDPVRLVDHVIWETYRLRQRGAGEGHGRTPRGLLYAPLKPLAVRSGLIELEALEEPPPGEWTLVPEPLRPAWEASDEVEWAWTFGRLAVVLQERLDVFLGEWRYLTYTDLQFLDHGQGDRAVGQARPDIVMVVEKSTLEVEARVLGLMFGVSFLILGGAPTWIATEFFVRDLLARLGLGRPVMLVSYCDYDPYGWQFPVYFRAQLERFGGLVRLVKAHRFTQQERELMAIPLKRELKHAEQIEAWIRETGGVDGRALGLAADYLRPVRRMADAFREETGLEPVMTLEEAVKACSR